MFKWITKIREDAKEKYNISNNKPTKVLVTRIHDNVKRNRIKRIILRCKFCKHELLNSTENLICKSYKKQRKIIGYKCPKCGRYLDKFEYWEC